MHTKATVITILSALILSVGAFAVYYQFWLNKSDTSTEPKTAVDYPLDELASNKPSTLQAPARSNLSVQSAQTTPPATNQLPTPNQFNVYEQYANADSTQYIDTLVGTGAEATNGSTVYMLYKGYLTSGELFDQSRVNEQNQVVAIPVTLGAGQVIQGWEQGIVGMKEGGKRRLIIPSQFGYGESGTPDGSIPPNSLLIFDVELVQVDTP